MSSTRRITRSSVKRATCLESVNSREPEQPKSTKGRFLKCSPVVKGEASDVYEFEADPNEPKAFKKKRQQNRKPKRAATRTRPKRVAVPTPPRTVVTRSTAASSAGATGTQDCRTLVCQAADGHRTEVCTPRKQPRIQVLSEKDKSAEVMCPPSSSTPLKSVAEKESFVQDEHCPPLSDIPEHFHPSFEEPGVYSVIDNSSISAFDLSHNAPSTVGRSSIDFQLPETSCRFTTEGQMKAQSTPLRPNGNKSLRIPFSPINKDRAVPHLAAKQNFGGYGKTARLDAEDLRKLCAVKETIRAKHADKNKSLLVDCAAEAEGVQSPVKASDEDVPLECPPSPNVHFAKPARRSYSSRPKTQRQIFQEEESESDDETRPTKRKNKASKKKGKGKDAQYDHWISQMKDHFDDIENYTLVCD